MESGFQITFVNSNPRQKRDLTHYFLFASRPEELQGSATTGIDSTATGSGSAVTGWTPAPPLLLPLAWTYFMHNKSQANNMTNLWNKKHVNTTKNSRMRKQGNLFGRWG
jgi:hypothetical protein